MIIVIKVICLAAYFFLLSDSLLMSIPHLDKYILSGTFHGRVIIYSFVFITSIYKIIIPCILFIFRVVQHNLVSFENVNPY